MGQRVGARYQQEFKAAFSFAAQYVGHWADPATAPGAWVAFRQSITPLGGWNSNVTDYEFHLRLTNGAEASVGLDARADGVPVPVVENRTSPNQSSIGDPSSRYGAWARKLKAGAAAHLALAEGAQLRVRQGGGAVNASVVFLDEASPGVSLERLLDESPWLQFTSECQWF
jgi:hypothetical protein